MNETVNTLITRRSVRQYRDEMIPDDILNAILEAGLYAPSGRNFQPVTLVAVRDRAVRDRLSKMNAAVMGADNDPFYGAPVVIVVLADRSLSHLCVEDGSLAMGNLMNAAHALGIGSCWIHRAKEEFESDEGKALLKEWGLEGDFIGIGHCILGYPAADLPPARERRPGRSVII